jgi:hypothetical protein
MLIFRSQKPSKTAEFVKNNEPASATGTPGDMWKRFLGNNGGTGDTFYDLEQGYLRLQGMTTWDLFLASIGIIVGVIRQRITSFLSSILSPSSSYYLQEDGTSKYVLEDGSGFYIME